MIHSVELRRREIHADDALPADLPPLLRRLYLQRGVRDAAELERGAKHLLPWQTLGGIEAAVTLLHQMLRDGRRIVVVGAGRRVDHGPVADGYGPAQFATARR